MHCNISKKRKKVTNNELKFIIYPLLATWVCMAGHVVVIDAELS
jgi:hypothetical protein